MNIKFNIVVVYKIKIKLGFNRNDNRTKYKQNYDGMKINMD